MVEEAKRIAAENKLMATEAELQVANRILANTNASVGSEQRQKERALAQLQEAQLEKKRLRGQVQDLTDKCDTLAQSVEHLEAQKSTLQSEKSSLESRLAATKRILNYTTLNLGCSHAVLETSQAQITELRETIEDKDDLLWCGYTAHQDELTIIDQRLIEANDKILAQQEELQQLRASLSDIQAQLRAENDKVKEAAAQLEDERAKSTALADELDATNSAMAQAKDDSTAALKRTAQLADELERAHNTLSSVQDQVISIESSTKHIEHQNASLRTQLDNERAASTEACARGETEKERADALQARLDEYMRLLAEATAKNDARDAEMRQLEERYQKTTDMLEDERSARVALERETVELRDGLDVVKEEVEILQDKLREVCDKNESLSSELDSTRHAQLDAKERIEALQTEVATLTSENATISAAFDRTQDELHKVGDTNVRLTQTNRSLLRDLKKTEEALVRVESECSINGASDEELREKVSTLTSEVGQLRSTKKSLENAFYSKVTECDSLHKKVLRLLGTESPVVGDNKENGSMVSTPSRRSSTGFFGTPILGGRAANVAAATTTTTTSSFSSSSVNSTPRRTLTFGRLFVSN